MERSRRHRQILNMQIAGLRYSGLWSLDRGAPLFLKVLYSTYRKIVFGIVLIFIVTLSVDLIANYNNLFIVTDDGCYLAGILVIYFKIHIFNNEQKRISQLIGKIYDPVDILAKSSDIGVLSRMKCSSFYGRLLLYFFLSVAVFLVVALLFVVPREEGQLPIRGIFPFDTTISPTHELGFFLQGAAITYGLFVILWMDQIVTEMVRWTLIRMEVLTANFQMCENGMYSKATLFPSSHTSEFIRTIGFLQITDEVREIRCFIPMTRDQANSLEDSFTLRFKSCMKNHQEIISIVDELNSIFGSSMLMQLFASFSMICLTGFQGVLGSTSTTNLLKFAVYLGAASTQLLNWCFIGNEMSYQSSSLFVSQCLSGWETELSNPNIRAMMIVTMIRTKKPLELKAGKFYTMSMHTFIAILRNSYSFFALLTTVTEA